MDLIKDLKGILNKLTNRFLKRRGQAETNGLKLRVAHNGSRQPVLLADDKPHNLHFRIAKPAKNPEWQDKFGSRFSLYWYVKPDWNSKSRKKQRKKFGSGYFDVGKNGSGKTTTRLSDLELGAPDYMASILPHDYSAIHADLKYLSKLNIGNTIHAGISREEINRYQKQIADLKKGLK